MQTGDTGDKSWKNTKLLLRQQDVLSLPLATILTQLIVKKVEMFFITSI